MSEPTMPAELWMFWATTENGRSFWITALDDASGGDDVYLVVFHEEAAKRVAREQLETFFAEDGATVIPVRIKPTTGPATKAMLAWAKTAISGMGWDDRQVLQDFIEEWPDPATPPAPEQPASVRTMKCNLCGEPVLMSNQAQLVHAHEVANHEAELSASDIMKILGALIRKLDTN